MCVEESTRDWKIVDKKMNRQINQLGLLMNLFTNTTTTSSRSNSSSSSSIVSSIFSI